MNTTERDTKNEFKIIPLSKLKDGKPVLGVSDYGTKSFAEFHLIERVIVPLNGDWEKEEEYEKTITGGEAVAAPQS
jgi:hypothetical protein